jgi:hypothetical protein
VNSTGTLPGTACISWILATMGESDALRD